jgi:hypothetical protein
LDPEVRGQIVKDVKSGCAKWVMENPRSVSRFIMVMLIAIAVAIVAALIARSISN